MNWWNTITSFVKWSNPNRSVVNSSHHITSHNLKFGCRNHQHPSSLLISESDPIKLAPFPWIVFSNPPGHPVLSTSPTVPSGTHISLHSTLAPFTHFALLLLLPLAVKFPMRFIAISTESAVTMINGGR